MKRLLLMSTVLMAVLLLPALASATHITEVVAIGDCYGFNAQLDIHFRSTAPSADLHYEVAVMDMDSNEIVMLSGDMVVMQEDSQDVTVMLSEMWGIDLDGSFVVNGTITLSSAYPGGLDEDMVTFESSLDCGSVSTDATSFESLKSMYR